MNLDFSVNKYSQSGEEIIVKHLLNHVDIVKPSGVLVEFGGSRGGDNSNLFALGEEGRHLVLIESDESRFAELEKAIGPFKTIIGLLGTVGYSEADVGTNGKVLSKILLDYGIEPSQVSVVSIDIDSDDAAVFECLGFVPDIAIVEFNPTFPADANFRNPPGCAIGNSPSEVFRVGKSLGMFLVAVTQTNLIFMKNQYASLVQEVDLVSSLAPLDLQRFGWGYDGTLVRYSTSGRNKTQEIYHNGWNDSFLRQPSPRLLRRYGSSMRSVRLAYFVLTGLLIQPVETILLLGKYVKSKLQSKLRISA